MGKRAHCTAERIIPMLAVGLLLAACAPTGRSGPAGPPPTQGASTPAQPAASASAPADPYRIASALALDELHQRALAEGGLVSLYASLQTSNTDKLFGAFTQRFPGMKVEQLDINTDKLVARLLTEASGGKVLADVFNGSMDYVSQVYQAGMFAPVLPPEAQDYPEALRGRYWVATDVLYLVVGWNTSLVRPADVPRQYDDLADPRWRNQMMADPQDVELLISLGRKYGSDERAAEFLRRVAANNVEFHRGHTNLGELLVTGQGAVCLTCFAHNLSQRQARGAPVDYMTTEGVGLINATAVLKDAPHPFAAFLFYRWFISEEGQKVFVDTGRSGAHPAVQPKDVKRPDLVYAMSPEDSANQAKYQAVWKDIFQLR